MTPLRGLLAVSITTVALATTASAAGAATLAASAVGTGSGCTALAALYDAQGGMGIDGKVTCNASSAVRTMSVSIVENNTRTTVSHTQPIFNRWAELKALTEWRVVGRRYKVCFVLSRPSPLWPITYGAPPMSLWLYGLCSKEFLALG